MKSDRDMISSIVPFPLGKPMEKIKLMPVGTGLADLGSYCDKQLKTNKMLSQYGPILDQ